MKTGVAGRETELPAAVVELVDAFSRSHGGAAVRIWAERPGGWDPLLAVPAGCEAAADPARLRVLGRGLGLPLAVEVDEGVGEANAEFLAAVLDRMLSYEAETRQAAEELAERYEEINLLYSISEILGSVLPLRAAASRILEEVADVLGARRASLWAYEPESGTLHLAAAVGVQGLDGPIPVDDPDSVTARVFRERQPLNLDRGTRVPRGTRLEPRPLRLDPFLSVPINYTSPEGDTRTVGVITLVGRHSGEDFGAGDARLLSAIASQIGAAIETHRLMRESVRQERLERELELAHDLQLKLLPDTAQFQSVARVAARCVPADSVGGDFFYLFHLSGGRLGVIIGDVSSHGFSAALIMALTISAIAIYAQEADPPSEVLRGVHRAIADELETTEMFVSLFFGVLDPAAGTLVYSNAGHPQAFIVHGDGTVTRLGASRPPLGTPTQEDYGEAVCAWDGESDLLCLFTDGLSDAFADANGGNAEANLLAEVVRLRDRPPAELLDHLFERAEHAKLGVPPDDRTAVLVRG